MTEHSFTVAQLAKWVELDARITAYNQARLAYIAVMDAAHIRAFVPDELDPAIKQLRDAWLESQEALNRAIWEYSESR